MFRTRRLYAILSSSVFLLLIGGIVTLRSQTADTRKTDPRKSR